MFGIFHTEGAMPETFVTFHKMTLLRVSMLLVFIFISFERFYKCHASTVQNFLSVLLTLFIFFLLFLLCIAIETFCWCSIFELCESYTVLTQPGIGVVPSE